MAVEKFILSVLVNNEAGVLTRVSGLFARRSFNIDSLSVAETQDGTVSRITISATGDDYLKDRSSRWRVQRPAPHPFLPQ